MLASHVQEPPADASSASRSRLFALSQCRFRAGAFGRLPGAFGDVADQLDFRSRPEPRCRVVGAERGDQLSAFQQHHPDERGDLSRLQDDPLTIREPWIGVNVVHHNRLAAPKRLIQGGPE